MKSESLQKGVTLKLRHCKRGKREVSVNPGNKAEILETVALVRRVTLKTKSAVLERPISGLLQAPRLHESS